MAGGHADDLATAVLLATDKPILIAPAMNPQMWAAKATARNLAQLRSDGVHIVGPNAGEMAERGEAGLGRMAEPLEIVAAVEAIMRRTGSLTGKRVLVTSGPTNEPIDPVRYIANRSSGKQGHAIAAAAAAAGAEVVLVSGPVNLPDPPGLSVVKVETAQQMLKAVEQALPADVAVFAAAVADWRAERPSDNKIKKQPGKTPTLALTENPDILSTIAHRNSGRPRLVIGFAAETDNVIANAQAKLAKKGCDWILANDVSPSTGIMGGDVNTIHLITAAGVESWPPQSKDDVARALIARIAAALAETKQTKREQPNAHRGAHRPAAARARSAVAAISKRARRRPRSHGRGAGRRAGRNSARRPRRDPDRRRDRFAARQRRPDPAAVGIGGPPRRHRAQHARNDRRRLPRRITGYPCQYWLRIIRRFARHAHRATSNRANSTCKTC